MALPRKYLRLLPMFVLYFGLRFTLETAFPRLQHKFGRNHTEGGVLALFIVTGLAIWFIRRAGRKKNE